MKVPMKKEMSVIFLIILTLILIKYFKLTDYLTIQYVHEHIDELKKMVTDHYWFSVVCYITTYICVTSMPIPGTTMLCITGGLLFGSFFGMIYAAIAATIGATILFGASRYLIGSWVQRRFSKRLKGFNHEMASLGKYYLLLLRLLAILPFCVVNMLSGLTNIALQTYIYITLMGLLPISFVYAYTGNQLANMQTIDDVFTPQAMSAFISLFFLKIALFPALIKVIIRIKRMLEST